MSVAEKRAADTPEQVPAASTGRGLGSLLRALEIDTRMMGMIVALIVIWIGFQIMSGGSFLTPRNLWNLSVQFATFAIMATGMVLVIVSRNIDLSVGSMLGFLGMFMALMQAQWLPGVIGFESPFTWVITLAAGVLLGALVGGLQGVIVAYVEVPSFIVTLGGYLVWRGAAWALASGQTIAPMDTTFQVLGGGARGAIGGTWSWIFGGVAAAAIVYLLYSRRKTRQGYGFRVRPLWAEVLLGVVGVGVVLTAVWFLNRYYMPINIARQYAEAHGLTWPEGGLNIPLGLASPVLITIGVALIMTYITTRRRFGRYVFAIGGNPEAAQLGGIKTGWTIVRTFMLMGVLVAVASAVQIARLNAATSGLGTLYELYVIAAAVIGGTSLLGGVGKISGAVLGALVIQSLQSGMVLMGVDAPLQQIVIGIVLVVAVAVNTIYLRRGRE